MLTVLIASSKGGCGKSTLATGLAGYFALACKRSVLIDCDPQGSSTSWASKRVDLATPVLAVDGTRKGWERRVPDDTQRLVIDTPAGSRARDLAPWLARADAVLVPVLPSVIDMEATLPFLTALAEAGAGRKNGPRVGLVGNRLKPWTQASQNAVAQVQTWPYPLAASLRDSQAYVLLAGLGRCLFDYHSQAIRAHQEDWSALFSWLRNVNRQRRRSG